MATPTLGPPTPSTAETEAEAAWRLGLASLAEEDFNGAADHFAAALSAAPQDPVRPLAGLAATMFLTDPVEAERLTADVWRAAPQRIAAAALVEAFSARVPHRGIVCAAHRIFCAHPLAPDEDPFPPLVAAAVAAHVGGDFDQAALLLARALRLRPSHRGALWARYQALAARLRYDEAVAAVEAGDLVRWMDAGSLADYAAILVRSNMEDEAPLRAVLALWAQRRPAVPTVAPPPRDPAGRRLRVGVSQAWFHREAYYNGIIPTLAAAARHMDLIAYHFGPTLAAAPTAAAPYEIAWRDMSGLTPGAAAERIAADRLDVLLDLEGLSTAAPMEVYRRRPAPVIATGYNTLCPMGPGLFDWVLADPFVIDAAGEADYDERVARLPGFFHVFAIRETAPAPAPDLTAPPTFGGYCQTWKISQTCARLWGALLAARPDARLILRTPGLSDPATAERLRCVLTEAGVALERVRFDGDALPYADHLRRYDRIDVLLDPFPFQGPSTIFEALWMGVPVVTRLGRRWVGRMGSSMLVAAGCEEGVATDEDDYLRRALVALDSAPLQRAPAARLDQRARVDASALCDQAGFGVALERALREMAEDAWRRR